ncbi:uncharacterized protein BJ212DRAFT_1302540 [Suillus subaureus]|uniref:Uncharacterized protein n=1 Tax=Suillus subaureus TaxID=48587 RepID=A0A9P7J974_9AGAM|nr:uncharacterized protein BJ212DRAFT_1302540 [Suillus subaureus]KAG1809291.1 hypothetical protein BJ212DRAFT_1302540 [Suillus subaureus]
MNRGKYDCNRFSLHQLDDGACIWTYNTDPVKTFPKQVIFGKKATLVIGGSNAGIIYVFDKNEGTLKQELQHTDKIASKTYNGTHHGIIFGATFVNDAEPNISIWSRQQKSVTMPTSNYLLGSAFKNFIHGIFQLAVAMALMAYISTVIFHGTTYYIWDLLGVTQRILVKTCGSSA